MPLPINTALLEQVKIHLENSTDNLLFMETLPDKSDDSTPQDPSPDTASEVEIDEGPTLREQSLPVASESVDTNARKEIRNEPVKLMDKAAFKDATNAGKGRRRDGLLREIDSKIDTFSNLEVDDYFKDGNNNKRMELEMFNLKISAWLNDHQEDQYGSDGQKSRFQAMLGYYRNVNDVLAGIDKHELNTEMPPLSKPDRVEGMATKKGTKGSEDEDSVISEIVEHVLSSIAEGIDVSETGAFDGLDEDGGAISMFEDFQGNATADSDLSELMGGLVDVMGGKKQIAAAWADLRLKPEEAATDALRKEMETKKRKAKLDLAEGIASLASGAVGIGFGGADKGDLVGKLFQALDPGLQNKPDNVANPDFSYNAGIGNYDSLNTWGETAAVGIGAIGSAVSAVQHGKEALEARKMQKQTEVSSQSVASRKNQEAEQLLRQNGNPSEVRDFMALMELHKRGMLKGDPSQDLNLPSQTLTRLEAQRKLAQFREKPEFKGYVSALEMQDMLDETASKMGTKKGVEAFDSAANAVSAVGAISAGADGGAVKAISIALKSGVLLTRLGIRGHRKLDGLSQTQDLKQHLGKKKGGRWFKMKNILNPNTDRMHEKLQKQVDVLEEMVKMNIEITKQNVLDMWGDQKCLPKNDAEHKAQHVARLYNDQIESDEFSKEYELQEIEILRFKSDERYPIALFDIAIGAAVVAPELKSAALDVLEGINAPVGDIDQNSTIEKVTEAKQAVIRQFQAAIKV